MDAFEKYNNQYQRLNKVMVAFKEIDLNKLTKDELDLWTEMRQQFKELPELYDGNPLLQDADQMEAMADVLVRIIANHTK